MTAVRKRFALSPFQAWLLFLATLITAGIAAGAVVLARGLVVTNLTDLVPWGLWITIDLASIAMSAGAFLLSAAVYLLGLKEFRPIARTAIFVGLVGYSMAVLTLMLDIGRPDRFWHALVFWNPHSLLWDVTISVTLYSGVLVLETAPIFAEAGFLRTRFPAIAQRLHQLHNLAPYLAVVGLMLSILHQSSLGATYGVLKARPIWYRPDLSVLFMASAMAGGPSLTVFISMLAARLSKRVYVKDEILEKLTRFIGWVLVGYLYFRFWDALSMTYTYAPGRTEGLRFITKGPLAFNFWVGEILFGTVIPIILLLVPRFRRYPLLRMLALALVVGGVVAYRWDTNIAGQLVLLTYLPKELVTHYTSYFPSLIEFLSGAGIIAYGALAVTLGVRYLKIVDHHAEEEALEEEPALAPAD